MPTLAGMAAASLASGRWSVSAALLCLVSSVSTCLAALVVNDIADVSGDDKNNDYVAGFSGGGRGLQDGLITRREAWRIAVALGVVSVLAGSALAFVGSPWILLLGALAALGGLVYSIGPRLVRKGWGDLVLGFCGGALPALCGWLAIADQVTPTAVAIAGAYGLATSTICFALHTLDAQADREVGKRTLPCRVEPALHAPLLAASSCLAVALGGAALVRVGVTATPAIVVGCAVALGVPLWCKYRDAGARALGAGTAISMLALMAASVAVMLSRIPRAEYGAQLVILLAAMAFARWIHPLLATGPAQPGTSARREQPCR